MAWLDHIVVGVDFSPASLAALRFGSFLAELHGAALHVIHVLPRHGAADEESWVIRDDLFRLIYRLSQLGRILGQFPEAAARMATVRIEVGAPVEALLGAAGALESGLLLVGKDTRASAGRAGPAGGVLAELRAGRRAAVMAIRSDVRVPQLAHAG